MAVGVAVPAAGDRAVVVALAGLRSAPAPVPLTVVRPVVVTVGAAEVAMTTPASVPATVAAPASAPGTRAV